MNIPIKGFIQNSMLDWEGKISSIVFFPNCNMKCFYCHAATLVCNPDRLENISVDDILKSLKERKKWIDGVVLLGGEPTLYNNLSEFIKKIKDIGLKVKLDTNGTNPEMVKKLIDEKLIDCVSMDIKAPLDKKKYDKISLVDTPLEKIKKTINILINSNIDYEFRTTISKQWLSCEDIFEIAKSIKGAKKYIIQKFRYVDGEILNPEKIDKAYKDYSDSELKEIAKQIKEKWVDCVVR